MKIRQVKIKNFRGYGINKNSEDGFYTFDNLDEFEIIILAGYNGYGKTSFYDSVEWCISDRIKRLIELDDVFRLGKKYLKDSKYLKFNNKDLNDGKAEVSLRFIDECDNEYYIKRVTFYDNFQESGYKSQCYNEYGDEMSLSEVKEFFSKVYIGNKDNEYNLCKINSMIKSNILGQERINEFLRLTKPNKRTEAIFDLVGLDEVSDIIKKSSISKLNNPKSVLSNIDNEKENFIRNSKEIEEWFKIKGYGDFENYFEKVKNDILLINDNLSKIDIKISILN